MYIYCTNVVLLKTNITTKYDISKVT